MADLRDDLYSQQERLPEIPPGYPQGHPVSGEWQLPVMAAVLVKDPLDAIGFDDRKRVTEPSRSIIHFYRDDKKFMGALMKPKEWVYRFMNYGYVLTPDLTLGDDMPDWLIAHRVFYTRAVGVIWQKRGIAVIPHVRWRKVSQIPQIICGLPTGSAIAVSNYGFRREATERKIFTDGLEVVIDLLRPEVVILYGSIQPEMQQTLSLVPKVFVFEKETKQLEVGPAETCEESLKKSNGTLF